MQQRILYIIMEILKKEVFRLVKDLTRGSPAKMILSFCMPLMIGQIFQQLYNMVDSIIVGRFAGTQELSAVGSTGSLSFMVIGFVLGMCSGFSIPVSQSFGEGDYKKLRRYFVNGIYLTLIISVVLTFVTVSLTGPVLKIMNTPDDIFDMAYSYISTVFAGLVATFFYNFFAGIMRALGDSRTPLYLLIFSSVVNVVLDLVFVVVFKMAVFGVAVATVIAQAVSALLAFIIILKKFPILHAEKDEKALNVKLCGRLLYIGLPMALQFSVTAVGSIMLQSAVNGLGSDAIAAVTVAGKIQLMLVLPCETVGLTMATYCGQNLGAQRLDRIKTGMVKSIIIALVYCVGAAFLAYFAGESLSLLFLDSSQGEVIALAGRFLKTCAYFYPILSVLYIYRNALQGLGYSIPAMLAGVFELFARGSMGLFVIPAFGYSAVCFAHPSAWIAADVFLIPAYYVAFHIVSKRIAQKQTEGAVIN